MARENKINVIDDVVCYNNRYGSEALAYALIDMLRNNEIHLTEKQTESLWEYGGNKGKGYEAQERNDVTKFTQDLYDLMGMNGEKQKDFFNKYVKDDEAFMVDNNENRIFFDDFDIQVMPK